VAAVSETEKRKKVVKGLQHGNIEGNVECRVLEAWTAII
jgi:hypothetical protein